MNNSLFNSWNPNDDRSNTMNPNNDAYEADQANREEQARENEG